MKKDVPFLQLAELLSKINDLELTLLKSHLLLEEALTDTLAAGAENPKYILNARLTFSNKCNLVRAFNESSCEQWVWKSLLLLNKIRNRLAHDLTGNEIEQGIETFVTYVKQTQPNWSAHFLKVQHRDFFWSIFLILEKIREIDK